MPPSASLENAGKNRKRYQAEADFAALLRWHLDNGTRPRGMPGKPGKRWGNKEFADAVGGFGDRTIRNWRNGRSRPTELGSIERELFGDNGAYDQWRLDLRAAYDGRALHFDLSPMLRLPQHFLGREHDVAAIVSALQMRPAPAILVQGGPGVGKTALTQAVALHPAVVERYGAKNRWFAALETATTAAAMRDMVMRAVGGEPSAGFDATLKRLGERPGLLVLDNLETPWEPTDQRIETERTIARLSELPDLAIVTSFRGHDRIGGAQWTLEHPVSVLPAPHDRELFCKIAANDFTGDSALDAFMKALGGIPLAIELVSARAHGRSSLKPLWQQWEKIGSDLAKRPDYDASRLTSLPRSIELSLRSDRLTALARRLFSLLGQLPDGLCAEDRDALLGGKAFEAEEALRNAGLAVEREVARRVDGASQYQSRLDLLPPIRDYARRYSRPEAADIQAYVAHFLMLTETIGAKIGTSADEGGVVRLGPEFANIEGAVTQALDDGIVPGNKLLTGLYRLAYMASLPANIFDHLSQYFYEAGEPRTAVRCQSAIAEIMMVRSDHHAARTRFEESLSLFRKMGDVQGEANCIRSLGDIAHARSDYDGARARYADALLLYRTVDDVLGEANCIQRLGDIALARSDHDGARARYEEALVLYRRLGVVLGEANCITSLGNITLERSDHDGARARYEEALPLFRAVGSLLGEANCIQSLGDIASAHSDHDGARTRYEEALVLYRRLGVVLGEANCIQSLGDIALARSDHEGARTHYETALPLFRTVGSVLGEANCIRSLGDIALRSSDQDGARTRYEEALELYRRIPEPYSIGHTHRRLSEIARDDAERTRHRAAAREAWESIKRPDLIENHLGGA